MPYEKFFEQSECIICCASAVGRKFEDGIAVFTDCSRCGDFSIDPDLADDVKGQFGRPIRDDLLRALASHLIRRMQGPKSRLVLTAEFFASLNKRQLPTPQEIADNFIVWLSRETSGRPGKRIRFSCSDGELIATIGVVDDDDVAWVVQSLDDEKKIEGSFLAGQSPIFDGGLTMLGWERAEQLKKAYVSSNYAFFARRFDNGDLDKVFEQCLLPAVKETGFELRTATQKAGPVDAIIEDEIRRCRFLLADLSDDNLGAYWEAGFAEGLGKPVIYVCRATEKDGSVKRTHFDTDHRHTVRWDLTSLEQTEAKLKAVIRNTLLGDAVQPSSRV